MSSEMKNIIELHNVSVTYPSGQQALQNISFSLSGGKICGLVGMNGAGKSTLFKSMMGFVKPTNGSIRILGNSAKTALKKNMIAYVPQTEEVDWNFPVLVEDVVMMGRYGHMGLLRIPSRKDKEIVQSALERVNMQDFRKRQIGELSGGQKKRVFVARALAQEGRVMFLDEPFTGVDIKTEDSLVQLFRSLAKDEGQLILVSTHNLGSVPHFCDEAILINRRLIASGPVETTFTATHLEEAFGGKLRQVRLGGLDLHDDTDPRGVNVLADDEHPLVFYGEEDQQKIINRKSEEEEGA